MGGERTTDDFFHRARILASAGQMIAGAMAISGVFLDWVRITARPELVPGSDFGDTPVEAPQVSAPLNGLDIGWDGRWVLIAGVVLIVASILVLTRARGGWYGFWAAIAIGAISFADYRGVGDVSWAIDRGLEIVGKPVVGAGLTLVAVAAVLGLIASVGAIAASPRARAAAS
ncbi:MAG: hypothetical protein M3345_08065 [Actinomycetota bacterium]|nr:hypothetical protein [Actinomycetota bacterium]